MGIAKLYGQKASGTNINGIIKDYHAYAGENISAGDLVEYINGITGTTTGTSTEQALDSSTMYSGYDSICAKELSDNRVIVVYSFTADYYLYAMVVTIDGATIIPSTDTQLINYDFAGRYLSVEVLPNGNVFIAHDYSTSHYLYGIVCTINGTTITKGTNTALYANSTSGYGVSTCLLPDGKVFVAHSYNSNYTLAGVVVTINGTTITKGTDTQLTTLTSGELRSSTVLLDNGIIFIAHSYNTSRQLRATMCTVSGTTITAKGTNEISATGGTGAFVSASLLKNGNVFVGFVNNTQYHRALAVVCAPNSDGTSLTKGSMITLSSDNNSGKGISTTVLPSGKVFVSHGTDGTNMNLTGTICTISGTTITKGTATRLNTTIRTSVTTSAVALKNGNVFIAHSYSNNYYLYAQLFGVDEVNNIPTNNVTITEYETQVRKTTTSQFDGVAKTGVVDGTVSIYTLPVIVNLIKNGDFESGVDGWSVLHSSYATFNQNNDGLTEKCAKFTITTPYSGNNSIRVTCSIETTQEHIYYARAYTKGVSSNYSAMQPKIGIRDVTKNILDVGEFVASNIEAWQKISAYINARTTGINELALVMLFGTNNGDITAGMAMYFDEVRVCDLTAMYGAGNEPTKEWCDANL